MCLLFFDAAEKPLSAFTLTLVALVSCEEMASNQGSGGLSNLRKTLFTTPASGAANLEEGKV